MISKLVRVIIETGALTGKLPYVSPNGNRLILPFDSCGSHYRREPLLRLPTQQLSRLCCPGTRQAVLEFISCLAQHPRPCCRREELDTRRVALRSQLET